MLSLKNIPLEYVQPSSWTPECLKYLWDAGINNIEDMLIFMEQNPDINWSQLMPYIETVLKEIERNNKLGKNSYTYNYKEYSDDSLYYTDALNMGNVLLLNSPTTKMATRFCNVESKRIINIKRGLETTTLDGSNYFLAKTKKIGPYQLDKTIGALDMYTDQVERQAEQTDRRDINLFTFQEYEKKALVKKKYVDIIAYLIFDNKELVWGTLTPEQKKKYLGSIIGKSNEDARIKEIITKYIAYYSTLPELENISNGHYKSLDRFIIKKQ